jgi:hypothetical protein
MTEMFFPKSLQFLLCKAESILVLLAGKVIRFADLRTVASHNAVTRGKEMGKLVHTSRITITRVEGPVRKAFIEGFEEPVFYGVHGGIKRFYKVEPKEEHAATLDHIIGAVGG